MIAFWRVCRGKGGEGILQKLPKEEKVDVARLIVGVVWMFAHLPRLAPPFFTSIPFHCRAHSHPHPRPHPFITSEQGQRHVCADIAIDKALRAPLFACIRLLSTDSCSWALEQAVHPFINVFLSKRGVVVVPFEEFNIIWPRVVP